MNLYAAQAEISTLDEALNRASPSDNLRAAKVALAWHLRQRDSVRALSLVREVMPLVGGAGPCGRCDIDGDAAASRARAALAASEAAALFGDLDDAERWLADARCHLAPRGDAHAEGDGWLAEFMLSQARGQRARGLNALDRAISCFQASDSAGRLAIARMWAIFELTLTRPDMAMLARLRPPVDVEPEATAAWDAIWSAARGLALAHCEPQKAAAVYQHASSQAQAHGMVHLEVSCMIGAGAAILDLGDAHLAALQFDLAAQRARATGWPVIMADCDVRVAELLRDLGAFDESRRMLSDAIDVLATGPRGRLLATAYAAQAQTLLAAGLVEESLKQVDEAIELQRAARADADVARSLVVQARALLAADRPRKAVSALDEAQALVDALGLDCLRTGVANMFANLHHRHPDLPHGAGELTLPTPALHHGESALLAGSRIAGWKPKAELLDFLAERWADAGDHARAYDYASRTLAANEQETAEKMGYPLALLRLRRGAEAEGQSAAAAAELGMGDL
jgi:tetratricopeptide (TPR) repeat protein